MVAPRKARAPAARPRARQGGGRESWEELIDAAPSTPDHRPVIRFERPWGAVPLHRIVPEAVKALAVACAESVYAHGEVLAHLVRSTDADTDAGPIRRGTAPRIATLPASVLRLRLDEAACWQKHVRKRNGEEVDLEAWVPRPVSDAVRDLGQWPGIRPLVGVVTSPTLRPDGSVLDAPGYDSTTGIVYAPSLDYPPVPAAPSEAEVVAALDAVLAPFAEFDLESQADTAAVLAYLLTLAGRPAILGPVPLIVVTAPAYGSGKTLLVEAATIAMTGHPPDMLAPVGGRPSDAESEMRKRLTMLVQEGPRAACVDNLDDGSVFSSRALAALLTTESWTDRVLGFTRRVQLPHRIAWSVTGCNVKVAGDLARRSLSVVIDPGVEDPHLRTFGVQDLTAHVQAEHPRLLAAALTILRGFVVAGRPTHDRAPLGKFESWDALVRGAVIWSTNLAGREVDPVDTQRRLLEATPDKEGLGALLQAWRRTFGNASTTCREVVRRATEPEGEALADAVVAVGADKDGRPDSRRLGNYLAKKAGNVVGGLAFERRGECQKIARWAVTERRPGR